MDGHNEDQNEYSEDRQRYARIFKHGRSVWLQIHSPIHSGEVFMIVGMIGMGALVAMGW